MTALVVAMAAFAFVGIFWAIAHDRNLAALERLDNEALAAEAADAWNRGEW